MARNYAYILVVNDQIIAGGNKKYHIKHYLQRNADLNGFKVFRCVAYHDWNVEDITKDFIK